MGVGNHDFDDGRDGLLPFAQDCGFPILAANLNISNFPEIDNWIDSATILDVNGTQVGIIGYITKDRTVYASYNIANITFQDEVEAVDREAKKLKEAGVDIIIAAGHAGYEVDLRMAEQVQDVDIIVGGHSHTFLYTVQKSAFFRAKIRHIKVDKIVYRKIKAQLIKALKIGQFYKIGF